MCLSFFSWLRWCAGHPPPPPLTQARSRTVLCACVPRMSRAPPRIVPASCHVYAPITSTAAELQLTNLQCSQRPQRVPLRPFEVPPARPVRRPDPEVLRFTYLMCADVICAKRLIQGPGALSNADKAWVSAACGVWVFVRASCACLCVCVWGGWGVQSPRSGHTSPQCYKLVFTPSPFFALDYLKWIATGTCTCCKWLVINGYLRGGKRL